VKSLKQATISVETGVVLRMLTHCENHVLVALVRLEKGSTSLGQKYRIRTSDSPTNSIWRYLPTVVQYKRHRSLGLAAVSTIRRITNLHFSCAKSILAFGPSCHAIWISRATSG
jgi:hypothetical protein